LSRSADGDFEFDTDRFDDVEDFLRVVAKQRGQCNVLMHEIVAAEVCSTSHHRNGAEDRC